MPSSLAGESGSRTHLTLRAGAATTIVALLLLIAVSGDAQSADSQTDRIATIPTPQQSHIVSEGLVAYWTLDEGTGSIAHDVSGNGHDGAIHEAIWTEGILNWALQFDGVDDNVDLGGLDVVSEDAPGLSISAWIKADSFFGYYMDGRILSKTISTSGRDHYWMLSTIRSSNDPVLRFRLRTDGSTTTLVASTGVVTQGEWVHAVATYDGQFMRLYKDNVEVGSTPKTGDVSANPSVLASIGNNPDGSRPWHGIIDDVRLYDRGLTPAEIDSLYQAGIGGSPPDVDPPTVEILTPTTDPTWETSSSPIELGGVASDNVGVTSVSWSNAATGEEGIATGTTSWTASIPLVAGHNEITVTARDAAGNTGDDVITVTFNPLVPVLDVDPTELAFTAPHGGPNPEPQLVFVRNTGVGLLEWTAMDDADWLTFAPESGNLPDGTTDSVAVFVTVGDLVPDQYNATLTIAAPGATNSPQDVSVTLSVTPDASPPSAPTDLTAIEVTETGIDLGWTPASDPESGISHYKVFRDDIHVGNPDTTFFSDTGLSENTQYHYEVSAVNGVGLEGPRSAPLLETTLPDTIPPTIAEVRASHDPTNVQLVFSEPVEQLSAETTSNYDIDNGISVNAAHLESDEMTVTLTTTLLSPGVLYTLTVNGIRDQAQIPNTIAPDTQATFEYSGFIVSGELVAYWRLDDGSGDTASDDSGNGHDGIVNGAAWTGGIMGGALLFDGLDDHVDLGALDVAAEGDPGLSISAWFTAESFTSSWDNRIISKTTSPSGQHHYWMLSTIRSGGDAVLRFRLKTQGTTTTLVAGSGAIGTGEWVHAVATYDGETMRLYKDNVLVGSTSKSGHVSTNSSVFAAIGMNPDGSRAWHGVIDDVRLYSRGLSPAEIDSLYQAGTGPPPPDYDPPTVEITIPTTDPIWETFSSPIDLGGTASDNVGVTSVTWANDATGENGDASGTTSWSASVPLAIGDNFITVTAYDAAGNTADDYITVTYTYSEPQAEITRQPYLQVGTPNSIIVRWRTNVPTTSFVRYGDAPGNLGFEVADFSPTTEHEVEVTGLSPDTQYYYAVGTEGENLAGDDDTHFFTTSPVPGTQKTLRMWVIGDTHWPDENQANVRDAYCNYTGSTHTDVWLHTGDMAETHGTDEQFQGALFDSYKDMLRKTAFWPARGNHDLIHPGDNNDYYEFFTLPTAGEAGGVPSGTEAYYSFDYANVHFICLDSYGSDRSSDGPMMTWLQSDVASTTQDWTIAYWHHPPYSKGSHNSDDEAELIQMRENALPILEAVGVDLVLCGHSHAYERSFLLDEHYGSSGTFHDSMAVDPGDGSPAGGGPYSKATLGPAPHEGTVYTVAGIGSRLNPGGTYDHPVMITNLFVLGSVVIDIDGNRLDAIMLDDTGAIRDDFTIIKGVGGEPPPRIGLDPTSFVFVAPQGGPNPDPQILTITNIGADTLSWTAADDAFWLDYTPTSGSLLEGESDLVTLAVDVVGLDPGEHNATITVSAPGAANSPQTVAVTLTVTSDGSPPTAPSELTVVDVTETEIDLAWSAAMDPESGIAHYKVFRDDVLVGSPDTTFFGDTGLTENTAYTYEVSAVNGEGLEGPRSDPLTQSTLPDTLPPTIAEVTTSGDPNHVRVVFSEPVEQSSAEDSDNYAIDNDVVVTVANLETDNTTVTLTTTTLSTDVLYTLTVNNVRDRAQGPNTIDPDTQVTFMYDGFIVSQYLVGYWRLDDGSGTTASDASGNGHVGVVNGAGWTEGILGGALQFDGIDDNVDLGPLDVVNEGEPGFAVSAWFKADSFNDYMDNRIISKTSSPSGSDHYWMVSTMQQDGQAVLRFRLKTDGETTKLKAGTGYTSPGEWVHAVATYDGQAMRLYKDNAEVGSISKSGHVSTNAAVMAAIGQNPDGSRPWHGIIDDVRLYRRGLTPEQVDSLYHAGSRQLLVIGPEVPLSPVPTDDPWLNQDMPPLLVTAGLPGTNRIHIRLVEPADVSISLYNILGRLVDSDRLVSLPGGWSTFTHSGRSAAGLRISSGVYYARVTAVETSKTIKLVILKK